MFAHLLVLLLVAAAIHIGRSADRTPRRVGEIALLYLLVGYCGVPMLALSVVNLIRPDWAPSVLGFPAGNPFQAFFGWSYLGMSVLAVLALRYRGSYLVAPALCWAIFFVGATFIHLGDQQARGVLTHGGVLGILASHGLISVLLVAALLASGRLKAAA